MTSIVELQASHKYWIDYMETMLEQHECNVDVFVDPTTLTLTKRFGEMRNAFSKGFKDGTTYMSEPREPSFEDDFDCDSDPLEVVQIPWTMEDLALDKAHTYAKDTVNRAMYAELKEAYKAGFLEGFSYRFTTNDRVSE
jgi:hypothetical protein